MQRVEPCRFVRCAVGVDQPVELVHALVPIGDVAVEIRFPHAAAIAVERQIEPTRQLFQILLALVKPHEGLLELQVLLVNLGLGSPKPFILEHVIGDIPADAGDLGPAINPLMAGADIADMAYAVVASTTRYCERYSRPSSRLRKSALAAIPTSSGARSSAIHRRSARHHGP